MKAPFSAVARVDDPGLAQTHAVAWPGSLTPATAVLAAWRAFAVLFFSVCALLEIGLAKLFVTRTRRAQTRVAWLHRWCRFACRVIGIRLTTKGVMPRSGLLVCNHLSYLDVIVLSALQPSVFVAKRDVRRWPLFGWLAKAAGTIFTDRYRRFATANALDEIREALNSGSLVVLFPEGTSSDGSSVLPFKSALLEPALALRCNITAAAIDYSLSRGSVADEVCYWRDMTLVPHLLNLFTKRTIEASLVVAPFKSGRSNRKELARELRRQIVEMRL